MLQLKMGDALFEIENQDISQIKTNSFEVLKKQFFHFPNFYFQFINKYLHLIIICTQNIMIDDQQKLLEDAKKAAKEQAYFMRKSLENADLKKGLKFASLMLNELKTSLLSPRNYYILYMAIFDYMRELQNYFKDDFRRGRKMIDLYQAVQHAPNIIARLYLMITVGSVYIQSHDEGSDKILEDLLQMMKSVQNPVRGLFIRYYFLKMCKDRLPDTGSEYESQNRGVKDAVQIIHTNLREATNLWMRIGSGRDKAKRIKQKNDLKMLVGENLMRISSLQGVNIKIYKEYVLTKMLELVKQTKDAASQEYLLDCMIQGFPQEFHINTLPQLLNTCSKQCEKEVDMKTIFIALMDRLSNYLSDNNLDVQNIENGSKIYSLFQINIQELVKNSDSSEVKSTLNLYSAFLQFTLKCYPTKHEYVNEILKDAANYCSRNESSIDDDCQMYISKFLINPLNTLGNVIMRINQYPTLFKYLKFKRRRQVAKQITKAVCKGGISLNDEAVVKQVLIFINPVLEKQSDYENVSEALFKDEQVQVAKLVFYIQNTDAGAVWQILKKFIQKFQKGGQERMKYTLPSTVFRLIQLAVQLLSSQDRPQPKGYKKIIQMIRKLIQKLGAFQPIIAIKLYLELLLLVNHIDATTKYYDEWTYETAGECLLLYEGQVTDTKQKEVLLKLIINSCMKLSCLSEQNYDTLVSNITSYCSKILKKNEQCQILLSCCYLFTNPLADINRIHEVLKRCAKLANTCAGQNIGFVVLFMDILESYLYFVKQKGCISDKDEAIPQLCEMVEAKLAEQQIPAESKVIIAEAKERWVSLKQKIH